MQGWGSQHCLHVACSFLAPTLLYAYLGSRYISRENPGSLCTQHLDMHQRCNPDPKS